MRRERRRLAAIQDEYEGDETTSMETDAAALPLGAATGAAAWARVGAMRDAIRRRAARQQLRRALPTLAARDALRSRGAEACAVARQGDWILCARLQDPVGIQKSFPNSITEHEPVGFLKR